MAVASPEKVLVGYDPTVISLRDQPGPIELQRSSFGVGAGRSTTAALEPVQGGDGFYEDFNAGLHEFLHEMKATGAGDLGPAILAGIDFDEAPPLAPLGSQDGQIGDLASFVVPKRQQAAAAQSSPPLPLPPLREKNPLTTEKRPSSFISEFVLVDRPVDIENLANAVIPTSS